MKPVILYKPLGAWGCLSVSPFCEKLEIWLKLAKIPYETRPANPLKAPKGKMPYIEIDNQYFGDSQLIIEFLSKKYQVVLDENLSPTQRALGHTVRRMLEEGTYFLLVYARWERDEGWKAYEPVFRDMILARINTLNGWKKIAVPLLQWIVPALVLPKLRRQIRSSLVVQGAGRHSWEEIGEFATQDLEAVSQILGDKKYLLGEQPHSVDATVYAFLSGIKNFPVPSSIQVFLQHQTNLIAYIERMNNYCEQ